jgi:hypothetical protein
MTEKVETVNRMFVEVNEKDYPVGRADASQVAGIAKILSRIGSAAGKVSKDASEGDYLSVISAIIGAISEEELIEIAALCIGSDKKFAEEYFDLVWVSEALAIMVEETNLDIVVRNFTRIASRFQ